MLEVFLRQVARCAIGYARLYAATSRAFEAFSERANRLCGSPAVFVAAVTMIVLWFLSGPSFHFSDTWQLIANTGTTLVTFLLGFVIANAQSRSAARDQAQMQAIARLEREHGQQLVDLHHINERQLEILNSMHELVAENRKQMQAQQIPQATAATPRKPGRPKKETTAA